MEKLGNSHFLFVKSVSCLFSFHLSSLTVKKMEWWRSYDISKQRTWKKWSLMSQTRYLSVTALSKTRFQDVWNECKSVCMLEVSVQFSELTVFMVVCSGSLSNSVRASVPYTWKYKFVHFIDIIRWYTSIIKWTRLEYLLSPCFFRLYAELNIDMPPTEQVKTTAGTVSSMEQYSRRQIRNEI
jgi:hypothetical protein